MTAMCEKTAPFSFGIRNPFAPADMLRHPVRFMQQILSQRLNSNLLFLSADLMYTTVAITIQKLLFFCTRFI